MDTVIFDHLHTQLLSITREIKYIVFENQSELLKHPTYIILISIFKL